MSVNLQLKVCSQLETNKPQHDLNFQAETIYSGPIKSTSSDEITTLIE